MRLTLVPALILVLISCNNRSKESIIKSLYSKEYCKIDSSNNYELYIPEHKTICSSMPLIVILDPHGSGNSAIKNFIESSEKYKCILVASNLIKNNLGDFIPLIDLMITDVKSKYLIGDQVIIAGFSGGARMGLAFAGTYKSTAVLACGALATKEQLQKINSHIFAIIGLADFNFPEAAQFILNESARPSNLSLEIAGDMHEWPSSNTISNAVGFLLLKNVHSGNQCIDIKEVEKEYSKRQKNYIDSFIENKQLLNASLVLKNISGYHHFKDLKYFKKKSDEIKKYPLFNDEINKFTTSLQFENKVRDAYFRALSTQNIDWWRKELNELSNQINMGGEKYMNFAYKRIKAYMGILCYSLSKNSIKANDLNTASKILEIYSIIEPNNPDMYFYSAVYKLKKGEEKYAFEMLNKSIEAGFSDTLTLHEYFLNL